MGLSNAALRKLRELQDELGDEDPRRFLVTVEAGQEPVFNELLAKGYMEHASDECLGFSEEGVRWLAGGASS